MHVKIGDTIYNSNQEPIMLILSDEDKENIKNMKPEHHKYCAYPENDYQEEEIRDWMKI